ncbi:hypothetical protein WA158_002382 [Blastocystis sp. Blastoise]
MMPVTVAMKGMNFARCFASASKVNKVSLVTYLKTHDIKGKRVFVRSDLNVPLSKDGKKTITDDTRIVEALPTLRLLTEHGAKVVLCTHLGKPKKGPDAALTLDPVAARLSALLNKNVIKTSEVTGPNVAAQVNSMKNGDIVLLENVRFDAGETKNKPEFVQALCDCVKPELYVNDAFGTAHRAHASTAGIASKVPVAMSGILLEKELKYLYGAIDEPKRPLAAIVGGAKVSTKLPVLESLMNKCETILVGGGMIFTFYKALGLNIGSSLVEEDLVTKAGEIVKLAKSKGVEFILPTDVVIANKFAADAESKTVDIHAIPDGWMGLDIGANSVDAFKAAINKSNTIVWNGPMGVFEFPKFAKGTVAIAEAIAERTEKAGAISIIGGGDSVSAVKKAGVAKKISHISTGGGASLEVLEGKLLPGVAALTDA